MARCLLFLFGGAICPLLGIAVIASAAQTDNLPQAILCISTMMFLTALIYRTTEKAQ